MSIIGDIGAKILDKVLPDANTKYEAKIKLLELQQAGEFKEEELRYSAINTEAGSADKWTSRARPSFMYVMYIIILACIPFSILYAVNSDVGNNISSGMKHWLEAIPEEMWWLFGAGYIGYTTNRTFEKVKGR